MPNLLFHEVVHVFLTLLAAFLTGIIFLRKRDKYFYKYLCLILIGAILGGFLVDIDHLFDYVLAFGLSFHPNYFFSGHMFVVSHKIYVPLHGWEWVIILGFVSYFTKRKSYKYFLTALTLGLLSHLIWDQFSNHATTLGYSFIYRLINNFDAKAFILR